VAASTAAEEDLAGFTAVEVSTVVLAVDTAAVAVIGKVPSLLQELPQ
jgi:hypothetical protein